MSAWDWLWKRFGRGRHDWMVDAVLNGDEKITAEGPPLTAENVGRVLLDLPVGVHHLRVGRQAEGITIQGDAEREELLTILRAWEKRAIVLMPCPICDYREGDREHAPDCRLAALIKG